MKLKFVFFGLFLILFSNIASKLDAKSKEPPPGSMAYMEREYFKSIYNGDKDLLEVILDSGLDPNLRDVDGRTGLIIAAEKGNLEIVKILIQKGADSMATFTDSKAQGKRRTALQAAEALGHKEVIKYLKSLNE